MANELSKSGISTGQDILAGHVTQSVDALTGTEAYDITVSGSLTITGSTFIQPTNVSTGTNVLTVDSDGKIYKTGSYSAGGGGAVGTLQQVMQSGSSTTIAITGSNISASGEVRSDTMFVGSTISHIGDPNTKIEFQDDDINLTVAGKTAMDITWDGTNPADTREVTFNESGEDLDVRIEGDTDANLFVTNAGTDKVGIGTDSPAEKLTVEGNISASGIVYGETGSFSHLQGNSPITVGDSITFQQSITSSGDISSSGFLFITASELDPASQILTFNTESGAVHYANFHISTSTTTNTIGDDSIDLDIKGPNVSVIASNDHKVTAKKSFVF